MIPKFRVWILNTKEMENVVSIDMNSEAITCEIEYAYGLLFITGRKPDGVLMQSTGLKDLNGVEIYEGDLVTNCIEDVTGFVYFDAKQLQIVISGKNKNWYMCGNNTFRNCEVIGNIYENPDIMKN